MSEQSSNEPFQLLGLQLKQIRQKLQESLAEVSGAVEIDIRTLERFEHGVERPSEDILMLLISHFCMQDDEAVTLWELAGYDNKARHHKNRDDSIAKQVPIMMMLALESRILYSDGVSVTSNTNGVVVNFMQNSAPDGQQLPIARIGMSREQTHNVIQVLTQALAEMNKARATKALPAPKRSKKKSDTN